MSRIFITGGRSQGKTEYASGYKDKGYLVVDDICKMVREYVCKENGNISVSDADDAAAGLSEEIEILLAGHENTVLIGEEMGCGIVPVEKSERILREINGRLNCILASGSDTVVFMCCGIPQIIKG